MSTGLRFFLASAILGVLPLTGACTMFRTGVSPEILSSSSRGDILELDLKVRKGNCYQLEKTADLRKPDWQPVGPVITARTGRVTVTDTRPEPPSGFYRVRLLSK